VGGSYALIAAISGSSAGGSRSALVNSEFTVLRKPSHAPKPHDGQTLEQRLAVRREKSRPLVADLGIWMRQQRALLSSSNETAKAINYLLNRWAAFTRFLDDGRVCLSNNAAERALRGVALGRKNWTFAGSDAGGHRAAAVYTLIETCKMNDVDPQAWLADVLARLPDHPANKVANLLPWNWKANLEPKAAVAA